jgi:hypothetical protein
MLNEAKPGLENFLPNLRSILSVLGFNFSINNKFTQLFLREEIMA